MGKLIVTYADGTTAEIPLDKERVTIGRHPDNDIPLPDKAVSGHHAVIITILKDSFLEDLDSTNGTLVNGRRVAKHPLADGDEIRIGRNTLRFVSDAGAAEDDFEKTMVLKPGELLGGQIREQVAEQAPPAAPAADAAQRPMVGKLRVASGPNQGKELKLTKALTTLGRPGVQVAAITRRADGYYIVHVSGQAGGGKRPLVNGQEIGTAAHPLRHEDLIELAGTRMHFLLEPAE